MMGYVVDRAAERNRILRYCMHIYTPHIRIYDNCSA